MILQRQEMSGFITHQINGISQVLLFLCYSQYIVSWLIFGFQVRSLRFACRILQQYVVVSSNKLLRKISFTSFTLVIWFNILFNFKLLSIHISSQKELRNPLTWILQYGTVTMWYCTVVFQFGSRSLSAHISRLVNTILC